ncbi:hypothetical protein NDN08_006037 [Rhodosorus marinus]|uniref:Uncharacterized protein n=1 Tax=Rhodosorus marinus TaxID=101924 RepID=A0AAV8UN58_9RHOD|nr:hypothetical protein NDN08_006037 [Rhodosorus marinus]
MVEGYLLKANEGGGVEFDVVDAFEYLKDSFRKSHVDETKPQHHRPVSLSRRLGRKTAFFVSVGSLAAFAFVLGLTQLGLVLYTTSGGDVHLGDSELLRSVALSRCGSDLQPESPLGTQTIDEGVCLMRRTRLGEQSCLYKASNSEEGFCTICDRATGRQFRVMKGHPDGLTQTTFQCEKEAVDFANFKIKVNQKLERIEAMEAPAAKGGAFERGIAMSVHYGVLIPAAAALRRIRQAGCQLPIEIFYQAGELDPSNEAVREILSEVGNIELREIDNKSYRRYYTKIYAVRFSSFDKVLLLDSDNLVATNPEYIFESKEFIEHGAIFWPDHWHPDFSPLFRFDETSLAWELFDVEPRTMYEVEAGQLLVDRIRSWKALELLAPYVENSAVIERLQVLWGDKDLFRFAFFRTEMPFYMIQKPPGLAGYYFMGIWFCGQTLMQYDPSGNVLFFHRNTLKLQSFLGYGSSRTWTHAQEFVGSDSTKYQAVASFWVCGSCWHIANDRNTRHIADKYGGIEDEAIAYVKEAGRRYSMSYAFRRHGNS